MVLEVLFEVDLSTIAQSAMGTVGIDDNAAPGRVCGKKYPPKWVYVQFGLRTRGTRTHL